MSNIYIGIVILAAVANGYAAWQSLVGAETVKVVAHRVHVSQKWMAPFGLLLACGALGLLIGLGAPALGTAAAIGLVIYFVGAVSAHVRARDPKVGGAVFFLLLAVAALIANLAHHGLR